MKGLWIYLGIINIITLLVYRADKMRARRKQRRIAEKTLLTWATLGGSLGAFVGMRLFRHKTNKEKFYIGVPATLLIHIIIVLILYRLV